MRKFIVLLTVGVVAAWSDHALALDFGAGGFWEHTCTMPAEFSCGGCAVSCPPERVAICTRGMNVWRGHDWACMLQPICSCQHTVWETGITHARWRHRRDW